MPHPSEKGYIIIIFPHNCNKYSLQFTISSRRTHIKKILIINEKN